MCRRPTALPDELVYAGFSLGASRRRSSPRPGPAPGVLLLFDAGLEPTEFGTSWPAEVPVQVHAMADDPEFNNGYDLPAATALVEAAADGELFLYPGDQHLFVRPLAGRYDAEATALMTRRVLDFLAVPVGPIEKFAELSTDCPCPLAVGRRPLASCRP